METKKKLSLVLILIIAFVSIFPCCCISAWLTKSFVVQPFYIASPRMYPTLCQGERVLVAKCSYKTRAPKVGDIIIFFRSGDDRDYVSRVVAVGGQEIEIKNGIVYINGHRKDEPYVYDLGTDNYGPKRIPPNHVFVMDDIRSSSIDSRTFGALSSNSIVGKVFLVYWPFDKIRQIQN